MKPVNSRRYRRRSRPAKTEGAFFKKENQESFFGGAEHETFFQPAVAATPAQGIARKCEKCEEDDKKVQRVEDKKEEEKVMKKEDRKEEDKLQRQPEEKKEEKLQRQPEKKEEEKVQKKEAGGPAAPGKQASSYIGSLQGKGNPLPAEAGHFFSSGMGYDFSNVKFHTGKDAAESAKAINAKAYTIGNNVVFNEGQYDMGSTEGKKLMAHELAHVVQQGHSSPLIQRQAPAPVAAPPTPKEQVLEALRRGSATTFLTRLRGLSDADANTLLTDDDFFNQVHRILRGGSYWIVFDILYDRPASHNNLLLHNAILSGDFLRTGDAMSIVLMNNVFAEDSRFIRVLRQVITDSFGAVQRTRLLQQVNTRGMHGSGGIAFNPEEAHYEPDASGRQVVTSIRNIVRTNFRLTSDQMRVMVRIHFIQGINPAEPFYFLGGGLPDVLNGWLARIDQVWNNQFIVTNGVSNLALNFVPMIVSGADDQYINRVRIFTDTTQTCTSPNHRGRAYETCWFTSTASESIAHEFGHMLGASDEYRLPADANEIPEAIRNNMDPEDLQLTTAAGIGGSSSASPVAGRDMNDSIMNSEHISLRVHERHVLRLVNRINAQLAAGVPRYVIRRRN